MRETKNELKWYAIKVQANQEKSVSQRLRADILRGDITHLAEILVPVEKSYFVKNGKRVFREKIKYPGYIYVQTDAISELQYALKQITGASGFVKTHSGEIQAIRKVDMDRIIEAEVVENIDDRLYVVGDSVKVLDTAFEGFAGTIEEINEKEQKVKVSVKFFGKSTVIDLSMIQIEKAV